jgi:hypothetical protein
MIATDIERRTKSVARKVKLSMDNEKNMGQKVKLREQFANR